MQAPAGSSVTVEARHQAYENLQRLGLQHRVPRVDMLVKAKTGDFVALAKQHSEDTASKPTSTRPSRWSGT